MGNHGVSRNIHMPQGYEAEIELRMLMLASKNIISAQSSTPIMVIVQNALLAAYKSTLENKMIARSRFQDITLAGKFDNGRQLWNPSKIRQIQSVLRKFGKKPVVFNGRGLFSMILPSNLYFEFTNKATEEEPTVKIYGGVLYEGVIDKKILGSIGNSLIHVLHNDYGEATAAEFINNIQFIMNEWLRISGFSIGLQDCMVTSDDFTSAVRETLVKCYVKAQGVEETTYNPGIREVRIAAALDEARNVGLRIARDAMSADNNFLMTVKSGAKGDTFNITQVTGAMGQQNLFGGRVVKTLGHGDRARSLPHYPFGKLEPERRYESRGFIRHSLIHGLNPEEFYFHAASGREGITDTAMKSVTGDTELMIIENSIGRIVCIGEWIDEHIKKSQSVEFYPDDAEMELVKTSQIYIPTTNTKGIVTWGEVTALTRHNPSQTLYKVTTQSGRTVTVVESKSVLVWNESTNEISERDMIDVKVGDQMPVTQNLPMPPIETTHLDISRYLPKTEYIFGTDYNRALKIIPDDLRKSRGWWDINNGTVFTLPYQSAARFRRATKRSVTLQADTVYVYGGSRCGAHIPANIKLDREFGVLIGLYLAEGDADRKSGHFRISSNDSVILDFVGRWMDRFGIKYEITTYNHGEWTSTSLRAFSSCMAELIIRMCGTGSSNKKVPDEMYTAPQEFVKGLLDGYLSGDGCVTSNSIKCSSASKRLMTGISHALSCIGTMAVYSVSKVVDRRDDHLLAVCGPWVDIFCNQMDFVSPRKNQQLANCRVTRKLSPYHRLNGVVLDKITSIVKIESDGAKVYDITVPSTLNFCLANGLHVRDTADTGYLQRRLIKLAEDLKVQHDGTVRANGEVFQPVYGENGYDPIHTVRTNGEMQVCNVSRLATRLNNEYAAKMELLAQIEEKCPGDIGGGGEPSDSSITIAEVREYINRKDDLLKSIRSVITNSLVDDSWTMAALIERAEGADLIKQPVVIPKTISSISDSEDDSDSEDELDEEIAVPSSDDEDSDEEDSDDEDSDEEDSDEEDSDEADNNSELETLVTKTEPESEADSESEESEDEFNDSDSE